MTNNFFIQQYNFISQSFGPPASKRLPCRKSLLKRILTPKTFPITPSEDSSDEIKNGPPLFQERPVLGIMDEIATR
jgi:hypothetical protein